MQPDIRDLVYEHDEIADLDPAARRLALRDILRSADVDDVAGCVATLADEIDGYGPISPLMTDPKVTDILINGPTETWVERSGVLEQCDFSFRSTEHLSEWCERFITLGGGRVDTSRPIGDARLADGSRMHVVLPPIAPRGPLVSIRKFPAVPLRLDDLVTSGSVTASQAETLRTAVRQGRSVVVSGATGSGKTTLLGALLQMVRSSERVVVIEELPELKTPAPNHVSLVARWPNSEGRGEVTLEELVRASLRMRPDRIVVGEVRGAEALPALWAMRTGHAGTMLSVHAASASLAAQQLVDLALMSTHAPSESALARMVARSVDLVVHMVRRDERRTIGEILIAR